MKLSLSTDKALEGLHCKHKGDGRVAESPSSRYFPGRVVRIAHEVEHALEPDFDGNEDHAPHQWHFCGRASFSFPGRLGRRHLSQRSLWLARLLIAKGSCDSGAYPG